MAKASNADVEKAFTAGFEDKDIDIKNDRAEPSEQEILTAAIAAETSDLDIELNKLASKGSGKDDDIELDNSDHKDIDDDKGKNDDVDEWDGVSPAMKTRFQMLEANLTKATNIANSASGRANKLQSLIDKGLNQKPADVAKPTSDQLLEAMTSGTAREKLGDDFPEFAVVLDEMDKSVSTSVGSAIDKLRDQMRAEAKSLNTSVMKDLDIKRALDNRHPGWETTVQGTDFKTWAYEGGPSSQESDYYDSLVFQATQAAPDESAALFDTAQQYFNTLVTSHPVWASEKGSLYGDPSGDAAISLLDMYVKDKKPVAAPQERQPAPQLDDRFEQNLAPTSGSQRQAPATTADDVEKAFSDGFNS